MVEPTFETFETPGAKVKARLDGDKLRLVMSGSVESRDAGAVFDAYWTSIDEAARRAGVKTVELDLSAIDFMNSSGILTLVRWLTKVKAQPAYVIVIHHDRNLTWQKTSVPVLAKLAPAVVRVATV